MFFRNYRKKFYYSTFHEQKTPHSFQETKAEYINLRFEYQEDPFSEEDLKKL